MALLLFLALIVGAANWLGLPGLREARSAPQGQGLVGSASPDAARRAQAAPPPPVERDPTLQAPQRRHEPAEPGGDAFPPMSWLPPPPKVLVAPPPPAPPPPAPTAPPLPFTFVGLQERGPSLSQPKAFLARGDALLVVTAGDTIENNYSVDSITAQQITLTYLPLKIRQTLAVAGAAR
jgi:hypothetical protein